MWNNYFAILSGFLLSFYFGFGPSLAIQIEQQFPLGTIGCLFTEGVCDTGVTCIDDLLFGTCPDEGLPRTFSYTLDKHDLEKLQEEMLKLVNDRFTWRDGYTQCIIQNVIISLSIKEPFSKRICYNLVFDLNGPVGSNEENEISSVLGDLLMRTGNIASLNPAENIEDFPLLAPSQKRDEIVRVHKYFDKNPLNEKIHKRKFREPDNDLSSYLSYYPQSDVLPYDPRYYGRNYENYNNYGNVQMQNFGGLEEIGLSYDDLKLVKDFLESEARRQQYKSKLSQLFSLLPSGYEQAENFEGLTNNYPGPFYGLSEEDLEPGYILNDDDEVYGITQPGLESVEDLDEPVSLQNFDIPDDYNDDSSVDDDYSLPPQFAYKLDQLIKGEMEAENLTDNELNFLTPYVTKMLLRLNNANQLLTDPDDVDQGESEAWKEEAMEADMMQGDDPQPFGVDEEDMMKLVEDEAGDDDADDSAVDADENATDEDLDKMDQQVLERQFFQKKSTNTDGVADEVRNEDVVDTDFAFVDMDQPLDEETAIKLVDVLEKIVKANPGTLQRYIVQGNKLKIRVESVLAGVNASTVAQLASDHKQDLEDATGLKFVKSGIGSQTEVEFKANDNRYFVVTFVLCGCIAGILLAVVAIYVIRRNYNSKKKLQQITAGQDGNEAASKDYQDLCRQRMQSKSSEKPEPLHTAASRVSSVSESQVRSPSSRSSTSSWSEEPVSSNMDISTGHIVLSYMEDHLKNKDRLDREWEAMCAYEADPSSTKVAEDSSNARKNRYADVLPYDHSRVVLTTNTNVSGSDYINASTITDHDPRNPAYVASQGPLPHTVADFWQMVWEQGSVVIVMLTKLTETGEAKCHRYWPEEGSDLYHIYEVHLVSEHIWCEDYLVRSFYLKNLQTGETRTVTQFHFLTWPDLGIPGSIKALLDFRRKVNKSYRGRSCPIMVHCSDGCGRTGTYCLVDMVLNRMAKGAKEIDIAATLEHIRDQRINMVKTKEQFQFALAAVAEEVHAILKALPQ